MKTKHVLILPTGEIYGHFPQAGKRIPGKAERLLDDVSLPALVQEADTRGWTHVWCYGAWEQAPDIHEQIQRCEEAQFKILPNWKRTAKNALAFKNNTLRSLYGYKKREGTYTQAFYIVFLEKGEEGKTWPFYHPQKSTPCDFLSYIDEIENALNMALGSTPASTGLALLDRLWNKDTDSHVLEKPSNIELENSPFAKAQHALVWQRPLTREELYKPLFLMGYDKNSAFPRAAKDSKIGVGDVTHITENVIFDHSVPGIWRINMVDQRWQQERTYSYEQEKIHTLFDAGMLDMPYWNNGVDVWIGTALIKYMMQQGFLFSIDEAYTFDKKLARYVYRPMVDLLWQLRSKYPGGDVLNLTYKAIMNSIIGIVRSRKLGTDSKHYRPDHSTQILANARALMFINICKHAINGHVPFMCATDALFYLTGPLGVPGMTEHAESLGGYKLIVKLPVTDDLLTILQQPEDVLKMSAKLTYIKELQQKANSHARL